MGREMTETPWRVPIAAMDGTDRGRWQVTIGPRWYSVADGAVESNEGGAHYTLCGIEERFLFSSEFFAYRLRGGRLIDVGAGASVALGIRAPGRASLPTSAKWLFAASITAPMG